MAVNTNQLALFSYDARREQARALRRAGYTIREIKDTLDTRSNRKISAWLAGLPAPAHNARRRAKDTLRAEARRLRVDGMTYGEIAASLGVSTSSCSLWCRDLPAPKAAVGRKRATTWLPRLARNEAERSRVKQEAAEAVGNLSGRELLLLGVALYWAEGNKDKPYARREHVQFTNSDASMVRLFMQWLHQLGVTDEQCSFRLQIHETADVALAHAFWAAVVGVDVDAFSQPTLKRHNPRTNRRNRSEDYHGCLVIRVGQSRVLYQRIEGWWRGISQGAEVEN